MLLGRCAGTRPAVAHGTPSPQPGDRPNSSADSGGLASCLPRTDGRPRAALSAPNDLQHALSLGDPAQSGSRPAGNRGFSPGPLQSSSGAVSLLGERRLRGFLRPAPLSERFAPARGWIAEGIAGFARAARETIRGGTDL